MVPSSVPMFMLVLMDVQRAPVSLLSNLPTTLAMLSSNLMDMIGKVAHLKFVKIVLQVPKDLVVPVVDLAVVEALVEDSEDVEALVVAEVADSAEAVAASEEVTVEVLVLVDLMVVLELPQPRPTLSPITLLPVPRETRLSMFATSVLLNPCKFLTN